MSYAKPVRFNAGASLFLSKQKDVKNMPAYEAAGGVIVGGSVGACGLKAWGGLGLRLSAGYGQRVAGPSTTRGHIVTWGVGLAIPRFR